MILNVVIFYDNPVEIKQYVKDALCHTSNDNIFVQIVVNKGCVECIQDLVQEFHGKVSIAIPNENLGYMNGLLYGFNQYVQSHAFFPEWTIFSNTDIAYDSDFFQILETGDYERDTWCIGPSVYVSEHDIYDNPVALRRRSLSEINRYIKIFGNPILGPLYVIASSIKRRYKHRREEAAKFVYEIHGCCFILSKDMMKKIYLEHFDSFMYAEETYIAELVYQNQKKTLYDNRLKVIHMEHTVTSQLHAKKIAKYTCQSMKYIRDRFY